MHYMHAANKTDMTKAAKAVEEEAVVAALFFPVAVGAGMRVAAVVVTFVAPAILALTVTLKSIQICGPAVP